MRAAITILVVSGLLLLALWLGLRPTTTGPETPPETPRSVAPDAIYARAGLSWPAALLIKPVYQLDGPEEFQLAPLLVGRTDKSDPGAAERYALGTVSRTANGAFEVDFSRPRVYHGESTAILRGREYRQLHYRWWYAAPGASPSDASQGFRMTLDDTGRAMIWEVLRDDSGLRLIFVATPLEDAAREEFGEPLPGRRYSIESDIEEAPDGIVPRVISPGPVPMGPFLYIDGPAHSVATLICRCMESQFRSLTGDREYELRPLSELEAHGIDTSRWSAVRPRGAAEEEAAFDDADDPGWLERCLRLPAF